MAFEQSKRAGVGRLALNLALGLLAAWLVWGLIEGPGSGSNVSPPAKLERGGAGQPAFPMRKSRPPLDEVLKKSAAFAARFDVQPRAPQRVSKPAREVRRPLATPVALGPTRPAYNLKDLRLAGVVIVEKGKKNVTVRQAGSGLILLKPEIPAENYAVFETRKTRVQVLVTEGEKIGGEARVVKIELDRVVLEVRGERMVLGVSPGPPKNVRPRRGAPPVLATPRLPG
ncbi:MAG: hypothetical protein ACE5JS_12285 [Nitrospinota bacterium]